ncbi:MAG TPA: hypothetical protein VLI67_01945, partial [Vicinamibacteria bacterium]|nr:hypothetical protein [Vicinamibacteria bacterium]
KSGYARQAGSFGLPPNPIPAVSDPNSVSAYVHAASPINVGQTGVRGFAGDSSGVICFSQTGVAPPNASGAVTITAVTCNVLQ